ncbi:MAG TPA: PKD domain-containing protein [Pseudoneobacillus sp.]|nr:PKD domain-containing protein [Pseudoneobacillus sp.]
MALKTGTTTLTLNYPVVYQNSYNYSEVLDSSQQGITKVGVSSNYRGKTGSINDNTSGGLQYARLVLVFNMPSISNLKSIDSATLKMWIHWDSNYPISENAYTYVRQVTSWNYNKKGWANRPNGYEGYLDYSMAKHSQYAPDATAWPVSFDVSSAAKRWYDKNGNVSAILQLDSITHEGGEGGQTQNHSWKKWWLDCGYEPRVEISYTYEVPDPPNVNPTISMTTAPDSAVIGSTVTFKCSSSDSDGKVSKVEWAVSDTDACSTWLTETTSLQTVFKKTGKFSISVKATDDRGGTATDTKFITISLPDNSDPIADFTVSKTTAKQDETITFTDKSYDPDSASTNPYYSGKIVKREWTFPADATWKADTQYSFANVGDHNVSLKVTDDRGATSTKTIKITIVSKNNAPTAKFTMKDSTVRGENVNLYDASSDPDIGDTLTKTWTASPSTGVTFSSDFKTVKFDNLGTYSISLKVTDAGGLNATVAHSITVENTTIVPTINFPKNNSTIYSTRPYIKVTGKKDPDGSYDPTCRIKIEFSKKQDFSSGVTTYDTSNYSANIEPAYNFSDNTNLMFKVPADLAVGQWYMRASQYDGHDWSNSAQTSFTIAAVNDPSKGLMEIGDISLIENAINLHRAAYGLSAKTFTSYKGFHGSINLSFIEQLRNSIQDIADAHNNYTTDAKLAINLAWKAANGDVERADFNELIDNLMKV